MLGVKRLERIRKDRKLSRPRLSRMSGVSVRTIKYAEDGRDIKMSTAQALAAALEVSLDELVGAA